MNRDRYESLEYDGRLYYEFRRIESENEDLQKELKEKDKEIERLSRTLTDYDELLMNKNNIIGKAIEYIKKNCIVSDIWKDLDFGNFVAIGKIKYKALSSKKVKELLDILKGVDKE